MTFQNILDLVLTVSTLIAALGALGAFGVYFWQKGDLRKNAANIILAEIRKAEQKILQIKETRSIGETSLVLPVNSWYKYHHLFIKKLDADQIELINSFYANCLAIEKNIAALNNYLPLAIEEKAKAFQQHVVALAAKQIADGNLDSNLFNEEVKKLLELIGKNSDWLLAQNPQERLLQYIASIQPIMSSTAVSELKKIAGDK